MSMLNRRDFIKDIVTPACLAPWASRLVRAAEKSFSYPDDAISAFSRRLKPVGRALELPGYYVWCNTPIYGPDGRVHVFFSRWPKQYGMGGWIHKSEIAHAVAASPETPFTVTETVLAPRPGCFDATTCHNPHIQHVDGVYCLFYMGNSNGKTNTKRIGLATADSLSGPWHRPKTPLLEAGPAGSWDDHCTTNPAFLKHPNGQCWLYYKSWNTDEYEQAAGQAIRGNRKYGLAIAETVTGPYKKFPHNPVIDFSGGERNEQLEDAFVWYEDGLFKLIARDMGFYDHRVGLYFESADGLQWGRPQIAYYDLDRYVNQPPAPPHLKRYGRLERPQLLMQQGRPVYLFTASQGGKYQTASSFIFSLDLSGITTD